MDIKGLSKPELVSILEIIESAGNSLSLEHFKKVLLRAKDMVEADFTICGLGRIEGSELIEPLAVLNGNYPGEWLDVYLSESLYYLDPVIRFHTSFSSTHIWGDIARHRKEKSVGRVVDLAVDHGVKYGLSTSLFMPESSAISIFAFSGTRDRFTGHHKKIADILTPHLNGALAAIGMEAPVPGRSGGVFVEAEAGKRA
ncbi:MAG: autoinducer binding domain-containing protein [Thermodesulfobacteriota bacterium]